MDHIDAVERLESFGWTVVHRPAVAVIFGLLLASAVVILLWEKPLLFAITLGAVLAVVLSFGMSPLLSWCSRSHRRALLQREKARQALEDELARCLCDNCASEDHIAAEYDGWSGTVHTFYFANAEFALLFTQANAGKVLG